MAFLIYVFDFHWSPGFCLKISLKFSILLCFFLFFLLVFFFCLVFLYTTTKKQQHTPSATDESKPGMSLGMMRSCALTGFEVDDTIHDMEEG